ncbi:MAG: hypothetical protein RL754_992 [Bacteroidota bacterium]|jgi:hypothetical protein
MKKLLSTALVLSSLSAFSWGLTGHRIVGHIAMEHLDPAVAEHIVQVLGGEDLAMVANWMDFIKSEPSYDSLNAWHYCTVESIDDIDGHHHPEQGDVWMAIEKFLNEIETGKYSVNEAFALRAIAHLIGDVHQPLHCGNGQDKGGNDIKVRFFWESSNLHRVWDSGMIDYWKMSYTEYSNWIMCTRSEDEITLWKNSTVKDWVRESVVAREECYKFDDPDRMGYRYIYDHSDLLHLRLAQAGVRLADALNKAYAARG